MRIPLRLNGIRLVLLVVSSLPFAAGCGSSGTTSTAPSALLRCGVSVAINEGEVPAAGGTGSVRVTAARECQWTASVDGGWLSIRTGANGQGDGVVEFNAASNADPVTRRGAVIVNGQRAEVVQSSAPCVFTLSAPSSAFGQSGGSGQVEVRASSTLCQWTAASDVNWITVRRASGQGSGPVPFDVASATGPPRTGSILIAGQQHTVTQSEGCAFSIAPASFNAPQSGGSGSIAITAGSGCAWSAASNVPWLRFAQSDGVGPASLAFTVDPSDGAGRTGTAIVAGQPFTVTQAAAGCAYNVQPEAQSVPGEGGRVAVRVSTGSQCAWSAVVNVPWLSIDGASAGSGEGTVTLVAAATTGPARTGTATIAGRNVVISQGVGCSYGIAPEAASVAAAGGTGRIAVTAPDGCAWTAVSSDAWLSVTGGASGTGNGEVLYAAAASGGQSRVATIAIGGRTFTLTQGQACTYGLSATSQSVPPAGGTGTVTVAAGDQCPWTATSNASWLTITSGATGAGTGTVTFAAAAQSGPPRTGTLTIAGLTFTVTQGAACTFTISPDQASIGAAGGTAAVTVTTGDGCGWSASSPVPWLRFASGSSGTGSGGVQLAIDANTGPARSAVATIAGLAFTVNQSSGCTFTIAPPSYDAPAAASSVAVTVTGAASCSWTAASAVPWLSITGTTSGTGSGTVQVAVAANASPARTGTVAIGGQTFTVTQASGCTVGLSQTTRQVPRNGGMRTVDVTAGAGCTWTAVSQVTWITVTSGAAGSGAGTVEFSVEANPAMQPRTGTIIIGGATLTIEQQ